MTNSVKTKPTNKILLCDRVVIGCDKFCNLNLNIQNGEISTSQSLQQISALCI